MSAPEPGPGHPEPHRPRRRQIARAALGSSTGDPRPATDLVRLLAADPARAALLSDFDGTLAPIVEDPAAARPAAGAPRLLQRLAAQLGRVGVISGRPAAFLAEHLGAAGPDVALVGVYGLEEVVAGTVEVAADARPWVNAVADVIDRARAEAPEGVVVEAKHVTAVLHWRAAPRHGAWCQQAAHRWASETGLVVVPARMAVELRPPVAVDKGTVVGDLAAGYGVVVYAGDDAGDLPAFDALDRLAEAGGAVVVRVVVADVETPAELVARADVVLSEPAAWVEVLQAVADQIDRLGS